MFTNRFFTKAVAMVLCIAFILTGTYLPVSAQYIIEQQDNRSILSASYQSEAASEDSITDSTETDSIGSEEAVDLDALRQKEGVMLSKEGKIVGFKLNAKTGLTMEQMKEILAANGNGRLLTAEQSSKINKSALLADAEKKYKINEKEFDRAVELHGDQNTFVSALHQLELSKEAVDFSESDEADILFLIRNGYGGSQAIAAIVASEYLDVSIDELVKLKAEEIEKTEQRDAEIEEEPQEPDIVSASIRMGVPYSAVKAYLERASVTAQEVEKQFAEAYTKYYSSKLKENESRLQLSKTALSTMVMLSSDPEVELTPDKILEKPYDYIKFGNYNINQSTGSYIYQETDLSIPGKGGLDLNIVRRFDSTEGNTNTPNGRVILDSSGGNTYALGYKAYNTDTGELLSESTFFSCTLYDDSYHGDDWYYKGNYGPIYKKSYEYTDAYYGYLQLSDENCFTGGYLPGGDEIHITMVAYLEGIEPNASDYIDNFDTVPNDYNLNEYGLGHGWRLGFSSIETYTVRLYPEDDSIELQRLHTADGQIYKIDFQSENDSHLEEYELNDMILYNNGTGYTGASYKLVHKDGKTEYFDSNGRNIAIKDRFGNVITLQYTYTSASQETVSQVLITDTVGNEILYKNENISASTYQYLSPSYSSTSRYNHLWTLSLNNVVIRRYYVYSPTDYSRYNLVGIKNEEDEITYYNNSLRSEPFNVALPKSGTSDGVVSCVLVTRVTYPNGLKYSVPNYANGKMKRRVNGIGFWERFAASEIAYTFEVEEGRDINLEMQYEFGDPFSWLFGMYEDYEYNTTVLQEYGPGYVTKKKGKDI
jgi:hypothetical protein